MNGYVWAVGGATVAFAGVLCYWVTRRYGWAAAVAMPVLALAALIAMQWQEQGLDFEGGIGLIGSTLGYAVPVLAGAATGILIARLRRG